MFEWFDYEAMYSSRVGATYFSTFHKSLSDLVDYLSFRRCFTSREGIALHRIMSSFIGGYAAHSFFRIRGSDRLPSYTRHQTESESIPRRRRI